MSVGGVVDGGGTRIQYLQQQQQQQQQRNNHHREQPQPQPQPPQSSRSQLGTVPQLLAGGISGSFSKTCTAPLARLTILFQVQGMHSDVGVLSKPCIWREGLRIVNEEGFKAFWKGNLVTIAHRLPYTSVNFYAYERYKSLLKSLTGLESHSGNASADICVRFVGGGLAGITAASAAYPLDLVRTRLAAQRSAIYYQGLGQTLSTICRDEGFFGLYKGMGATLLGVGPSIAISFSVYESLRSYWQSHRPNDSTVMVSLACGSLSGIASSTDLREDKGYQADHMGYNVITTSQGEELRKQIGAAAYIECNSKTQQNVKDVFDTAIKAVLQPPRRKEMVTEKRHGISGFSIVRGIVCGGCVA